MNELVIEAKNKTPKIFFSPDSGLMEIRGMSSAENAMEFYKPILEWIEEYKLHPAPKTTLSIFFKYFNTSSAKCILDVLEKFSHLNDGKKSIEINWHYEKNDEEMYDAGDNFGEILELKFNLIEL